MKNRLRLYIARIGMAVLLLTAPPCAASGKEPELYARSAVLMDGDSGRILYGVEENAPMPMASTTKIMTCIVALEQAQPDTVCTVSENASAQPEVKLGMAADDRFYLKDLLYSLMLESHNDTAVCIAEAVGGSVEGFAALMNEKAVGIGCRDTYYITPNGLDAQDGTGDHHTTAKELALVMRYCLTQSPKAEEFLEVTRTPSYSFTDVDRKRNYDCRNHNTLLTIMEGAVSGKTGFTGKAGYCYIGAVEQEGRLLIVSLLACGWPNNKGYKWSDTKKLAGYAAENFEKRPLIERREQTPDIPVTGGKEAAAATYVAYGEGSDAFQKEQEATGVLLRDGESAEVEIEMDASAEAPVEKNHPVGTIRYVLDGSVYAQYPIVTACGVPEWNYVACLKELLAKAFI